MQGLCPTRPLVGVGAVIIRDNEILLVRRGQPPAEGSWSIPGGKVELGETLVDALCREIKEECNLDIEVGPPIAVLDSIVRSSSGQVLYHYALVDFWVYSVRGTAISSSDAREVRWVPLAEVSALQITQGLVPLLDHLGCAQGQAPKKPPAGIFYFTQSTHH